MYHSLMVLAMGFVSYDGLSIVSQDTINLALRDIDPRQIYNTDFAK